MTARYDPAEWDALEQKAEQGLAENGRAIAEVRRAIDGMHCAGVDPDRAAVLIAGNLAGPPATDDAMREVGRLFGMVLRSDLAPAGNPPAAA